MGLGGVHQTEVAGDGAVLLICFRVDAEREPGLEVGDGGRFDVVEVSVARLLSFVLWCRSS